MDFWRTVVVLFRRWYITVPAFFATLGLAAAAFSAVPVQYESGSILVLTTPLTGGTESTDPDHPNAITNPMMNFDRSLSLAASLVIQQLRSSETAHALGIIPGDTTSYEVNNGSSNPEMLESGPFIFVRGLGPSPEAAQDMANRVSTMAAAVLEARQEELNAPPSTHIERAGDRCAHGRAAAVGQPAASGSRCRRPGRARESRRRLRLREHDDPSSSSPGSEEA